MHDADNTKYEATRRALSLLWLQRLSAYYRQDPMVRPARVRRISQGGPGAAAGYEGSANIAKGGR